MLSLPTDVQFLVLDYISSKRDYRALCATSQGLCALVAPRLYNHIKLIAWDYNNGVLKHFARGVAAGENGW